jgi:hypothetical protein
VVCFYTADSYAVGPYYYCVDLVLKPIPPRVEQVLVRFGCHMGRGLHSFMFQLILSRFRHKLHPEHPLILLKHPLTPPKHPLNNLYMHPYPTECA